MLLRKVSCKKGYRAITAVALLENDSLLPLQGVLFNFVGGVCRWDSETLAPYQTMFSCLF